MFYRNLMQELDTIKGERDSLRAMVDKAMTTTERNTLLTIIAFCALSDTTALAKARGLQIFIASAVTERFRSNGIQTRCVTSKNI